MGKFSSVLGEKKAEEKGGQEGAARDVESCARVCVSGRFRVPLHSWARPE